MDRANAKARERYEVLEVTERKGGPYVATVLFRKGSQVRRVVVASSGGVVWRFVSNGDHVPSRVSSYLEKQVQRIEFLQKMHAAGLT